MGISHTVFEINIDFTRKSQISTVYLTPSLKGFPCNWVSALAVKKPRMMGLLNVSLHSNYRGSTLTQASPGPHTLVVSPQKASKRLYLLKQLKRARVPYKQLLHFYTAVIRPVLEYAAPTWHHFINRTQAQHLESVQNGLSI